MCGIGSLRFTPEHADRRTFVSPGQGEYSEAISPQQPAISRSELRFATTQDGVRIAFCTHGAGPALVLVRGWISNLDLHWDDPAYRGYFSALARHFRVVRYDMRGNGLSDRRVPADDLSTLGLDLDAVVAALELDDIILYGATYGGLIAIDWAARNPQRVSKLILDGSYARGKEVTTPERAAWILSMLRDSPDVALQRVLSHYTNPDPDQAGFRKAPARQLIDPGTATQLYALGFSADVSSLLPEIQMPTLVLHRTRSMAVPFRLGRDLAASLPNARFAALDGTAHHSWEGDGSAGREAVGSFLEVELEPLREDPHPGPAAIVTILFTDMASSTAIAEKLGDASAQRVRRTHDAIVRSALSASDGSEIKHTGDGVLASFSTASAALHCAVAIQQGVATHRRERPDSLLGVYIGLNSGEPISENDDLYGTSINLAARICDQAEAGQILTSNVVRDLVAGKGFRFGAPREAALKGFDTPVRLHELLWKPEPGPEEDAGS
jgi:pimeloyl-ACP methyl ester carboxylesterase